jgi:hypothetical protein
MEMPGFILVVEPGKSWLTEDGDITDEWSKRGIWETQDDAERAKAQYCA